MAFLHQMRLCSVYSLRDLVEFLVMNMCLKDVNNLKNVFTLVLFSQIISVILIDKDHNTEVPLVQAASPC